MDLLDGTAPLDAASLAALARERAWLGAQWLAGIARDDGSFHYYYYPRRDWYDTTHYNLIRHAGTTYSMYQVYELADDPEILLVAEAAAGFIERECVTAGNGGGSRAFVDAGVMMLGGQALALVALLERRRVLGSTSYDGLIGELATFLLQLEFEEEPGRFANSWDQASGERRRTPDSDYYPGEALLALTRLAQHFPDGPYLAAAIRAAEFLVHVRDGDLPVLNAIPREDHWLTMALSELYLLRHDPAYASVAYLQATSMIKTQYTANNGRSWQIGGSRRKDGINYTSTATKGEALAAVWALANYVGHTSAIEELQTATMRNAQFRLRVQFTHDNTARFPRPGRVIGAWGTNRDTPDVRLDFVQHNISANVGLWYLARKGSLPSAREGSSLLAPAHRRLSVEKIEVFTGPGAWSERPVVHLTLNQPEFESGEPAGALADRLSSIVASLPDKRLDGAEGDLPGHVFGQARDFGEMLALLALTLQQRAGWPVTRAGSRSGKTPGNYDVFCEHKEEAIGRAAFVLALRIVNQLRHGIDPDEYLVGNFNRCLDRAFTSRLTPFAIRLVTSEAERRGIPVRLSDHEHELVELGSGRYQRRFWNLTTSQTSRIGQKIAGDKHHTKHVLHERGLPAPKGARVRTVDEAVASAERIGFPVVVKPLDSNNAHGAFINRRDASEVRSAFPRSVRESRSGWVVVEQCYVGTHHRIMVINDVVVAVVEVVPARVVGDGVHSIETLIEHVNAEPRRHGDYMTQIVVDDETEECLQRQGLSLADVPVMDQIVSLKQIPDVARAGISIDRTDDIHPHNAEIARQAAMAVGLDLAGVDFVTTDISRSVWEIGGGIVEVNSGSGLQLPSFPTEGGSRNIVGDIFDMLFPPEQPNRASIVSVTGSNATAVSRLIATIFAAANRAVGLATSEGVEINGTPLGLHDNEGTNPLAMVLRSHVVESAVLEIGPRDIEHPGLAFDRCDVAVITGGPRSSVEGLYSVESVLLRMVAPEGASVINADDPHVVELAREARGELILVSESEQNPFVQRHVDGGNTAILTRSVAHGRNVVLCTKGQTVDVLMTDQLLALSDDAAASDLMSGLLALAAAIAQGIAPETIRAGVTGSRRLESATA